MSSPYNVIPPKVVMLLAHDPLVNTSCIEVSRFKQHNIILQSYRHYFAIFTSTYITFAVYPYYIALIAQFLIGRWRNREGRNKEGGFKRRGKEGRQAYGTGKAMTTIKILKRFI